MSAANTLVFITSANCVKSDIVRYMAAVKGIEFVALNAGSPAAIKLAKTLGITEFPAVIERALIVTEFDLIVEFFEERYPEPALFPADATSRAMVRTTMRRLHAETFPLLPATVTGCAISRAQLESDLAALDQMVYGCKYFGSVSFGCMDINLVPFLHAALKAGMITEKFRNLRTYAETHIQTTEFQSSLPSSDDALAA